MVRASILKVRCSHATHRPSQSRLARYWPFSSSGDSPGSVPRRRESYGLGLVTYTLSCGTFHGHEGGVNGTASIAMISPDATDGVVIALNLRSGEDPGLPALADQMLCGSP
jgi:hypothetical protein